MGLDGVKFYPNAHKEERANESIKNGHLWLLADIKCPSCGKEQSVANTGYVGGPCIKCGEQTISGGGGPSRGAYRNQAAATQCH